MSPQKTFSSPSSPNLETKGKLEFDIKHNKIVREQNTRNFNEYSKYRNYNEQYIESNKSFNI